MRKIICLFLLPLFVYSCQNQNETEGCTNSSALNYNPDATVDDGSCVLPEQYPLVGDYISLHSCEDTEVVDTLDVRINKVEGSSNAYTIHNLDGTVGLEINAFLINDTLIFNQTLNGVNYDGRMYQTLPTAYWLSYQRCDSPVLPCDSPLDCVALLTKVL